METAEAKRAFKSGYYRVAAEESLSLDSEPFAIEPGQVYEAKAWVVGYEGNPGCALVAVILLGGDGADDSAEVKYLKTRRELSYEEG